MIYPMQHKIIKPFAYTNAANTDIRKVFERIRDAANKDKPVLAADSVPAGATTGNESDISTAECH